MKRTVSYISCDYCDKMSICAGINFIPLTWSEMECNAKPAATPTVPAGPSMGAGRGAGAGRGRPGRGQPPQPGAEGEVGKGQGKGKVRKNVVGKIPRYFRDCRDTQGREVCFKFQSGGCTEGSDGMCWQGSRVRMLTLCLSKENGHKDCPLKK